MGDLVSGETPGPADPAPPSTDPMPPAADDAADSAGEVVSLITGNVSLVQTASAQSRSSRGPAKTLLAAVRRFLALRSIAHAGGGLDGILVSVEGTADSTETDPQGFYSLDGDYSGPTVLHFDRAEDGISASLEVSIPKGGSLSLHDMNLDGSTGRASAGSQGIGFDGVVVSANCVARNMVTASRFDPQGPQYTVDLSSSALRDSSGERIGCPELRGGEAVQVTGIVHPDGIIGDGSVVVADSGGDGADVAAGAAASTRLPSLLPPSLTSPAPGQ